MGGRLRIEHIDAVGPQASGIERLDQIKYAVLEINGGISIIPYR